MTLSPEVHLQFLVLFLQCGDLFSQPRHLLGLDLFWIDLFNVVDIVAFLDWLVISLLLFWLLRFFDNTESRSSSLDYFLHFHFTSFPILLDEDLDGLIFLPE